MKDDIMSISEQEKAQLFQCERRMAIMIAAKAASSTEGANHDIMKQNHLLASVILRNALSELCSRYNKKKNTTYRTKRIIMLDFLEKNMEGGRRKDGIAPYPIF